MKKILYLISLIAVCGFLLIGCGEKNVNNGEIQNQVSQGTNNNSAVQEQKPNDVKKEEEKPNWEDAYNSSLDEFEESEMSLYTLYDLDKDDVPEMIVKHVIDENDTKTYVYDYKNEEVIKTELKEIGKETLIAGWNTESTVLFQDIKDGYEDVSKLVYVDGEYTLEKLIEKRKPQEGEDYLLLESIGLRSLTDKSPFKWEQNPLDANEVAFDTHIQESKSGE